MAIIKNAINFGSGFNITAAGPIDSRMRVKSKLDLTTVWDTDAPYYAGMIVTVTDENQVYILKTSGYNPTSGAPIAADPTSEDSWVVVGSGNGSVAVETYGDAVELATSDNIGQIIYVTSGSTYPAEGEDSTQYDAGPYIVTGEGSLSKIGTTTASGDLNEAVTNLETNVTNLQSGVTTLQSSVENIEKEIEELKLKDIELPYLTITALEDDLKVLYSNIVQYSLNGTDWVDLSTGTASPAINTGEKIYFKGTFEQGIGDSIGVFIISKRFNLSGNCMSLIFGDEAEGKTDLTGYEYVFSNLFASMPVVNVSPNFLPATTLSMGCYEYMFQNCTSLETAPELPATTLAGGCYEEMFYGCTSLVNAPELPATTLAGNCYINMFQNCTSLETAPELPATTLAGGCYRGMFVGCTSLNYIKMSATDISASGCLENWVSNVSPTGTFVKSKDATWNETGNNGIPEGWTVKDDYTVEERIDILEEKIKNINTDEPSIELPYLTITALEDDLTVSLSVNPCQYSLNGTDWNELQADEQTPAINTGEKIYFKAEGLTPNKDSGIGQFRITKRFNLSGNVMSMLFGDDAEGKTVLTGNDYAFSGLFLNTPVINVSPNFLPATTLANYCYSNMFQGCTSLVTVPELPAIELNYGCYRYMFGDCTSLVNAPVLPATTLTDNCYYSMFENCTSLETAPDLPVCDLDNNVINPLKTYGYYGRMFKGCKNLKYIKSLVNLTMSPKYTAEWLSGVSPTGTFVKSKNALWHGRNHYKIPEGWNVEYEKDYVVMTALEDDFKVSATFGFAYSFDAIIWNEVEPGNETWSINKGEKIYLKSYFEPSYFDENISGIGRFIISKRFNLSGNAMSLLFWDDAEGKTDLTGYKGAFSILFRDTPVVNVSFDFLPATTLAESCYANMFAVCTSLVNAPELPATTLAESCYVNMFRGCTSLNYIKMLATDISAPLCLSNWVSNVSPTGTFVKSTGAAWDESGVIPEGWTKTSYYKPDSPYLTMTALEDDMTVSFTNDIKYSLNGNNWIELPANEPTPLMKLDDEIHFKGNFEMNSYKPIGQFTVSKKFNLSGNVMAMIFGDDVQGKDSLVGYNNCFYGLFEGTPVVNVSPNFLPATQLANYCYAQMFKGCTSLETAPELPAAITVPYCYYKMFYGTDVLPDIANIHIHKGVPLQGLFAGTKIVDASSILLPGTVNKNCYESMFEDCTLLTTPPVLPATELAEGCYKKMFKGCTSLEVPQNFLPATTLADYCYYKMFYGTNVDIAVFGFVTDKNFPIKGMQGLFAGTNIDDGYIMNIACIQNLLAILNVNCYESMFEDCTSLTQAPVLPATTLAEGCYKKMFKGCTSLETAPELPATTLVYGCYDSMFEDCSNLTTIDVSASVLSEEYTRNWVKNLPENGEITLSPLTQIIRGINGVPLKWDIITKQEPSINDPLKITTLEDNTTISFSNSCSYSINDGPYVELQPNKSITNIAKGAVIYFKAEPTPNGNDGIGIFTVSKKFNLSGNVMSMLFGDNAQGNTDLTGYDYVFSNLFSNTPVVNVSPNFLPATTLANRCYMGMFAGCTSLVNAPELPATTLGRDCYNGMFAGCTSLVNAPELPATTLAEGVYRYMFKGCTSLETAPELPATTLKLNCYEEMFKGCTSLVNAPELPATTLTDNCYSGMFAGCTSLVNAPQLPTANVSKGCYSSMFKGCTSLVNANIFPIISQLSRPDAFNSMFAGCTSLNEITLPIQAALQDNALSYMFENCINLKYINTSFGQFPTSNVLLNWVKGVSSEGIFILPINCINVPVTGFNGIPEGWEVRYK